MRVLVAGGAGFIGSHLCERLLAAGNDVVAVDNLVTGRRANVHALLDHPSFHLVEHDVCRPLPLGGPTAQAFDLVLHLASPASPTDFSRMPIEILEVGSAGTRTMLDIARRDGARFLMASSSEVYGDPEVHPQSEDYLGSVDCIGPRSCYDEAKRYVEALTEAYRRTHGVDTVIVRIFNTYGPRMRADDGRVLSTFIGQALRGEPITVHGDGSHTRSYCFVDDMVSALLAVAASSGHGPYNVGTVDEHSTLELAELVRSLTGSSSPVQLVAFPEDRSGDPQRRRPDLTRVVAACGWRPTVSLLDGLSRMIASIAAEHANSTLVLPSSGSHG